MAVDTQAAALFTMTPPPSDLDEFDKAGLLACSPSVPGLGLGYPSPSPSSRGHAPSVSTESIFSFARLATADPRSQRLQPLAFPDAPAHAQAPAAAAAGAAFFPIPPTTDSPLAAYSASSSGESYAMFPPSQWFGYANFAQPSPLMPYESPTSTPFSAFENPTSHQPGLGALIPPTPQDVQATVPFDFAAQPGAAPASVPAGRHLLASPSFSHVSQPSSHSHRSRASSLSRSSSPAQSLFGLGRPGAPGDAPDLRAALRSNSSSSSTSLHAYGIPVVDPPALLLASTVASSTVPGQAWRCAFPGCTSRATFTRGCDLRKHYNRHSKHLFCRIDGCPQSEAAAVARAKSADHPLTGGFSSKKDRARHEAKHNPGIKCEWREPDGKPCPRVFSRMDNMKDHVRRIHNKVQAPAPAEAQARGASRK